MIQFDKYYFFPAQEVANLAVSKNSAFDSYPYQLTVVLRSGRSLGVSYKTEDARDKARASLVARIECELAGDDRLRDIQARLSDVSYALQSLEKRQRCIFGVVKKLQASAEGGPGDGEEL